MKLYLRLLNFLKPYWTILAGAMLCMVVISSMEGAKAYLFKPFLDDVVVGKDMQMLKILPFAVIIVYGVYCLANYGQTYLMGYVGQRVVMDIRNKLYEHVQALSVNYFTETHTGIIMSRITNDTVLVQGAVSSAISSMIKDPLTIITLMGVAFYYNWRLTLISLLIFPLSAIPISKFGKKFRRVSKKNQEKMADITTILYETISGIRIVKAFGMEETETEKFKGENFKYFKILMKALSIDAISSPFIEFLGAFFFALIIYFGFHHLVFSGKMTPGAFGTFLISLSLMYKPIKDLTRVNNSIQQGLAACERIFELLDTEVDVKEAPNAFDLSPIRKNILFKHVCFSYSDQDGKLKDKVILNKLNFEVKVGEVLAIVGYSGGGKTTLVNLIPRFYDATSGDIYIDGHNIKDVTIRSLRSQLGIVTQETILFYDTIKKNIAYGNLQAKKEDIIRAAKAGNAHDFIMELPEKYDTMIGERGVKLSGGQRQRIAIARAILKNPPILILDEATSALDNESEFLVQEALTNLMRHRTTFVIAHRLSTIRNADKILVIDNGSVVEHGKHSELLALGGLYTKLYEMQFSLQQV
ncbi:MAG: lipid A export permease/ATP-binding protein MsbA [bacterium]